MHTTTLHLNNTRYATRTRRKLVCGELDATKEVRQNGCDKTEVTKGLTLTQMLFLGNTCLEEVSFMLSL